MTEYQVTCLYCLWMGIGSISLIVLALSSAWLIETIRFHRRWKAIDARLNHREES